MKIFKKVKLKLRRIADCLPVPIRNRLKDCILKYRKSALIVAAALGLLLAFFIYNMVAGWFNDTPTLKSSITILALSLPTLFTLWMFRTHDTQEQLKKTEENTNNSTFFECARLLATKDSTQDTDKDHPKRSLFIGTKVSLPEKIALEQLAYLRRETSFNKEKIDILTKYLFLNGKVLDLAQLNGINLSNAKLRGTYLIRADLSNAKLHDADLRDAQLLAADLSNAKLHGARLIDADLTGADLCDAKLIGTDLSNIKCNTKLSLSGPDLKTNLSGADLTNADLTGAKLKGTIYNNKTIFTGTSLDNQEARDKAGMKNVDLEK